jgi:histidinol-phosphate aminotransferase
MNLPAHVQKLPPYVPGESVDSLAARLDRTPKSIVKLDANENTYGTSPAVRHALASLEDAYRYPDAEQRGLRNALSAYTGVPAECLIAGNGSDELLSLLSQVLLEPGDNVLVCPPTFSMYAFYTRLKNCNVVNVPRKDDFSLDVDGILSTTKNNSPKMVFIDSPGNPSGLVLPQDWLEKLLALPALIILDEAYIEFSNARSQIHEVENYENLVVLRTFSKWAGLAGFRVGYGAFPEWLCNALWQVKSPYNVTTPAMVAASAALDDLDTLKANIAHILADRERLAAELRKIPGLNIFPSEANFLLVRVETEFGMSAKKVCDTLKEHGILVRLFENLNSLRITIGKTKEVDILLEAVSQIINKHKRMNET